MSAANEPEYGEDVFASGREGARLFDLTDTVIDTLESDVGMSVPDLDDIPYNAAPIKYDADADAHSHPQPRREIGATGTEVAEAGDHDNATIGGFATTETDTEASAGSGSTPASRYADTDHVAGAGLARPHRNAYAVEANVQDGFKRFGTGLVNIPVHRLPICRSASPSTCPLCERQYALVSKRELKLGTYRDQSPIMEMVLADAADVCCVKCDSLFDLDDGYDGSPDTAADSGGGEG